MQPKLQGDDIADTPALHVDVAELPALSTYDEFAAFLAVSRKHLERMVRNKRIVMPIRVGDRNRWRRSDILQWLEGQSSAAESAS